QPRRLQQGGHPAARPRRPLRPARAVLSPRASPARPRAISPAAGRLARDTVSRMEPISHRVEGADGLSLHVLEWSREGVPMILLHGHGNEAHLWDDFVPAVAPYYRVLAVDQRGHGDSDWDPQGRYDADALADDLERIL